MIIFGMSKLMSINDIAKMVKRTNEYVRLEIKAGRLKAQKIGRDWVIQEEDYKTWQKRRRPRKP